ncbi:uncharacterized protein [Physcomitrium patens]|uniref:uncharacterized protein isoform X9 n=1 Tax=Physcomitrium patens TaxID=3218 RepID=UPI003CCDA254
MFCISSDREREHQVITKLQNLIKRILTMSPLNSFSEFISNEIQMKLPMNRLWKCLQDEELTMDAVGLLPKFSSGNAFAKRIKHATSTGTQMLYLTHSHT